MEKIKNTKGEQFLQKLQACQTPEKSESSSEDSDEDKFDWYKSEDMNYFTITTTEKLKKGD